MGVEPKSRLWVAIGADPAIRATRLMIDKIPPLPPSPEVRRTLRSPIFFRAHKIPRPSRVFLRQAFPRLAPQFVRSEVGNGIAPSWFAAPRANISRYSAT